MQRNAEIGLFAKPSTIVSIITKTPNRQGAEEQACHDDLLFRVFVFSFFRGTVSLPG